MTSDFSRRAFLTTTGAALAASALSNNGRSAQVQAEHQWLPATPQKLPRWRGFNLLEKFHRDWTNKPFVEDDFRLISQLGFNFVRLPMDYRVWIKDGDWEQFDEAPLKEIDLAVEWGARYGVHVCPNFHRAPGYTVASPKESTSLWTDEETQRVCAKHWALFARRYRGIPNERVSFNLFNEPAGVEAGVHAEVVRKVVAAIRAEDPDRLILADGLQWGQHPALELADLGIAQATRGYAPGYLTHYKASWVDGADKYPLPTWPRLKAYGLLYGSGKPELQAPLVIDGPFAQGTRLRLHVQSVSQRCHLLVETDGKTVFDHDFVCGPGEGEWKQAVYREQWKIHQNVYDRDYEAAVPAGTKQVRVHVTDGDWMEISELGVRPGGADREVSIPLINAWAQKPAQLRYQPGRPDGALVGTEYEDRQWLWDTMIKPWKEAEAQGIGVMVGEFGAFNKTPHDVVLRWMEDCLTNWQKAGWGWALWNFRGSFGILDSGREDVQYEDFEGHKLDRKMLDLLQRY